MMHQAHAAKSRIETRLSPEEDPEFQIAPMIDILLVLLIFFMSISASEVLQRSGDVQLPVAQSAFVRESTKGQIIVNVVWNGINNAGAIRVDEVGYNRPEQLLPLLQAAMEANPRMRMLIRADKNVRYEFLKQVMIAAGHAGVSDVTFSVVDKEEP
jgi:biopolymer transport protein ExbD